jgi:hypothetical protein
MEKRERTSRTIWLIIGIIIAIAILARIIIPLIKVADSNI